MNIAIIGLGLIGGSIGRATLKFTDNKVFGYDKDETVMIKAELLNAITCPLDKKNLKEADLIIVALSPKATAETLKKICPDLKDGAIVTDTCGNKRGIVAQMKQLENEYPNLNFCGVHPMAGREFSGISHSTATLFEKSYVILTPVNFDIQTVATVKQFYLSLQAQDVEICSADRHDKMIAYTSQLAHVVSSSYIKNNLSANHAGFSAGSFRDLTRVAKLNPDMWTELFLQNKDNLVGDIDCLISELQNYRNAINNGDAENLRLLLENGVKMKENAEEARKERLK